MKAKSADRPGHLHASALPLQDLLVEVEDKLLAWLTIVQLFRGLDGPGSSDLADAIQREVNCRLQQETAEGRKRWRRSWAQSAVVRGGRAAR
eukprot:8617412-Pyramimonas_sp.AAC.1